MANDYKPLNNAATNLEELLMVQNSDGVYASKYNGKEPFEVLAAKTIFNNYADVQAAIAADVEGPASSTDNALARFDGTTGKLLQNSNAILTDAGALSLASNLTVSGTGNSSVAGNLGIGETSPVVPLHVKTTGTGTGDFDNAIATLRSTAAGRTITLQFSDTTNQSYISSKSGALNFGVGGATLGMSLSSSGNLTVSGTGGVTSSGTTWGFLSNNATQNGYAFYASGASADQKYWHWQNGSAVGDGTLRLRALNDALTNGTNALIITRTGISSTAVEVGGNLTVSGTGTSSVAGNLNIGEPTGSGYRLYVKAGFGLALGGSYIECGEYDKPCSILNHTNPAVSANLFQIQKQGTGVFTVSSAGNLTVSGGSVLLNALTGNPPQFRHHPVGTADIIAGVNGIRLLNNAASAAGMSLDANNDTTFSGNLTVNGTGTSSVAGTWLVGSSAFSSVQSSAPSITNSQNLFRGTPDGTGFEHAKILGSRDTSSASTYASYLAFFTEAKASGTTDTSTEKMRLFANGNLFIGASPVDGGQKLQVSGDSTLAGQVNILNANSYLKSDASNLVYETYAGKGHQFKTGGTTALTLDSSQNATFAGKVGIGVSPSSWELNLQQSATNSAVRIISPTALGLNDSSIYIAWASGSKALIAASYESTGSYRPLVLSAGGVDSLTLDTSGNSTFAGTVKVKNQATLNANGSVAVGTSATTIFSALNTNSANWAFVFGDNGTVGFADLVVTVGNGAAVVVISSASIYGSPPARTYTSNGTNLQLSLASGSLTVRTTSLTPGT